MTLADLYLVLSNDISVVLEENTPNGIKCVYVGKLRYCDCDYMSLNVAKISRSEKSDKLVVEIF